MWLRDIETCHIQDLLKAIANQHHITRTTVGHAKHLLSGIFRYAAQQGFLDRGRANPVKAAAIPRSAPKGREGEAYSLEEIVAMLNLVDGIAATAVATAAYSGLRMGELRGLRWEDYAPAVDADSLGAIHVNRSIWRSTVSEPKTERSKGAVPVIPALAERLDRHRKAQGNPITGPIFATGRGTPMSLDRLFWLQMRGVFKKANIRWRGCHGFRRGLASNLNRLGVDDSVIQAILRSLRKYQESLDIRRQIRPYQESLKTGDQSGIAASLYQSGQVQAQLGKPESAKKSFKESLRIDQKIGDRIGVGRTLIDLGNLYDEAGTMTRPSPTTSSLCRFNAKPTTSICRECV